MRLLSEYSLKGQHAQCKLFYAMTTNNDEGKIMVKVKIIDYLCELVWACPVKSEIIQTTKEIWGMYRS